MRHTKTVKVPVAHTAAWTCDRCGVRHDERTTDAHLMWHWDFTAGYGSIFGDGDQHELDLCEPCVKELLGPFLRPVKPT